MAERTRLFLRALLFLPLLCVIVVALRLKTRYSSAPLLSSNLQRCLAQLGGSRDSGDPPWLAVYGDSLARGLFFDLIAPLNGSGGQWDPPHAGHFANYSVDCRLTESRPPTRRPKCGGFAFDVQLDPRSRPPLVQPAPLGAPVGAGGRAETARLTYRLKTFTWEAEFDAPWLRELERSSRLPDVLVLSFGIWDMQYPPDVLEAAQPAEAAAGPSSRGADAFVAALRRFLSSLRRALDAARRRGGSGDNAASLPRIYWLTVTAVTQAALPAWKRPRMSAAEARRYNELAAPLLDRAGIAVIDTYSSGFAHPELSVDGVHFPGALSRHHARLLLRSACREGT